VDQATTPALLGILFRALQTFGITDEMSKQLVKVFDSPTFFRTESTVLPFIKITGISATISLTEREPIERPLRLANIVSFVLRNLESGVERVIDIKKTAPIGKSQA
jgi:hypothetical protein